GSIDVHSVPGKGTTFTVHLPATVDAEPQRPVAPVTDGRAVLVVDDDPRARDLLGRMLAKEGFRVIAAEDGASALTLARSERLAVITLDIMMPGMDGFEVLRALKRDPATRDIPVIMVSVLDERQMGFTLGAADYVTKPVDRRKLLAALEAHAGTGDGLLAEVRHLAEAGG
ncbi:MAG: response regulator, partial [Gemmatimonadales bacterium]